MCSSAPTLCLAPDVALPLPVAVQVESEDLCEIAREQINLEGRITPHVDFDSDEFKFGEEKFSFFQSDVIPFRVAIESLNGFPFEASSLLNIRLRNVAGDLVDVVRNGKCLML